MSSNSDLIQTAERVHLGNYKPQRIVLSHGEGCRVRDVDGNRYLDMTGGIAVVSVGHCHPRLAAAIAKQAGQLMHVSNLYFNDRAIAFGDALIERTVFDKVYFCNSGAEANETLLKLGRRYHYERGDTARTKIVTTLGSFHGRTMGALSLTGQPKYHKGMAPMVGNIAHVPYNDIEAAHAAIDEHTAAFLVEPIQGEGGIIVGDPAYLRALRERCDEVGALLLFDEVQTGFGRTGKLLAREHSGVIPDACALAKGIGGGFPLGAALVREKVAHGLPYGSHASTYGGNPLACAAGHEVLSIIEDEGLIENAVRVGAHLGERLEAMAADERYPLALEARGEGLLRGLAMNKDVDGRATLTMLLERGVLLCTAGGYVLRFAPPLNVTTSEIDEALEVVEAVLANLPMKAA